MAYRPAKNRLGQRAKSQPTKAYRKAATSVNDKLANENKADIKSAYPMTESSQTPLLLRAALGEAVERPPVWMMRQAGRYMKAYRDLREKYPSFRDRSEIPEVAIEVSLQPWKAFSSRITFSNSARYSLTLGICNGPAIKRTGRTTTSK